MIKFLKEYWIFGVIMYLIEATGLYFSDPSWWEYALLFPLVILQMLFLIKTPKKDGEQV